MHTVLWPQKVSAVSPASCNPSRKDSVETEWEKKGKWWKLPPLFKREATDKIRVWQIRVKDNGDNTATIEVEFGQLEGKQQVSCDVVAEGKNLGRKNATTPFQQAMAEAYAEWSTKQNRKGYALSPDETRDDYRPMLAQPFNKVAINYWDSAFGQIKYDGCLDGEWRVLFADGQQLRIRDVVEQRIAGKVAAYDTQRQCVEYCEIEDWLVNTPARDNKEWFELELENGIILPPLTGNHRVFLPELNCWRRVDELQPGDKLLSTPQL